MILLTITIAAVLVLGNVSAQLDTSGQSFDYVEVREGAHMFYWLYYTTAEVERPTERPLVVWLQGGPGGSSTAIGNFEILGPMDINFQERDYTWVKNFNVLFVDNPVGTGFSYVEDLNLLTTTNEEIADDFVKLMQGFYDKHPEFEGVPLYIYGQSYGGKMAIDMSIKIHEAEVEETIRSNLKGVAMGNAWISPVDATLTWGPLLLAAGLIDEAGYDEIQSEARLAERLFEDGDYWNSTAQWASTQRAVFRRTGNVDFYNILTKMPFNQLGFGVDDFPYQNHLSKDQEVIDDDSNGDSNLLSYQRSRDMMIRNRPYTKQAYDLNTFMNTLVRDALGIIPPSVRWDSQSSAVFDALRTDFMKPVTEGIEKLLNETDIIVTKYNGNLDLICDTPGQILWVDRLKWDGAEGYRSAPRLPIWENDRLEGYYKSYGNFRFFWINVAGHSVPRDNPAGSSAFLRDMTSFG